METSISVVPDAGSTMKVTKTMSSDSLHDPDSLERQIEAIQKQADSFAEARRREIDELRDILAKGEAVGVYSSKRKAEISGGEVIKE